MKIDITVIKYILMTIWQAPQVIAGLVLSLLWGDKLDDKTSYYQNSLPDNIIKPYVKIYQHSGKTMTLGNYIFLNKKEDIQLDEMLVYHQYGHSILSLYTGGFYLGTVFLLTFLWDWYGKNKMLPLLQSTSLENNERNTKYLEWYNSLIFNILANKFAKIELVGCNYAKIENA